MRGGPLRTPVLFLIFNRPETTARVFEAIRQAKPRQLFVTADGPRPDKVGEVERCDAARNVVRKVDWECEVWTKFRETNLGLRAAVTSGIDWFFEHVEEGIILEDDCLPSQSFFWFCQEMLGRYRDDERIMQISGNNFLLGRKVFGSSYYFSRLNDIWGWATWRRAWRLYDEEMKTFPQFKEEGRLRDYIDDEDIRDWLMSYFEEAYSAGRVGGIWSSRWAYAMCVQNGLTIVPSVNLVANIGFAGDGTHPAKTFRLYATVRCEEMTEMIHHPFVLPDREADAYRFEVIRQTDPRLLTKRCSVMRGLRRLVPLRSGRYLGRS